MSWCAQSCGVVVRGPEFLPPTPPPFTPAREEVLVWNYGKILIKQEHFKGAPGEKGWAAATAHRVMEEKF